MWTDLIDQAGDVDLGDGAGQADDLVAVAGLSLSYFAYICFPRNE